MIVPWRVTHKKHQEGHLGRILTQKKVVVSRFGVSKGRIVLITPFQASLQTLKTWNLLKKCLEQINKIFSQMVVKNGDKSHGTIRKKITLP